MDRIAGRIEEYFKEATFWEALDVYTRHELALAQQQSRLQPRQPNVQAVVVALLDDLQAFHDAQGWLLIPDGQATRHLISLEGEVAVLLLEGRLNDDPDLLKHMQAAYRQGVVDGLIDPDTVQQRMPMLYLPRKSRSASRHGQKMTSTTTTSLSCTWQTRMSA